jgi:hypothetical protein
MHTTLGHEARLSRICLPAVFARRGLFVRPDTGVLPVTDSRTKSHISTEGKSMSLSKNKCVLRASVLLLSACPGLGLAQVQKELWEDYAKQVQTAEVVATLGNDLFGDQVNLYTGTVDFSVTDVSLRGNNALPVEVRRRFAVEQRDRIYSPGAFADWELDLPYLSGVFAVKPLNEVGWQVTTSTPNARCSVSDTESAIPPDAPPIGPVSGGYFRADEYWAGNSLHVPGGGSQEMLVLAPGSPNRPTDGATYYWATSGHWYFSCLTSTSNGITGEGFLARSPDGLTYRFDRFIRRPASTLHKTRADLGRAAEGGVAQRIPLDANLPREEIRILPTRVEDRFGNWVTYTYADTTSDKVTQILSSDGRQINLVYGADGVSSVTADGRTWTYTYDTTSTTNNGTGLTTVTLPDNSRWQYDLTALRKVSITYTSGTSTCDAPGWMEATNGSGTITHPSGAVGTFAVTWQRHGRSYASKICLPAGGATWRYAIIPQTFDTPALVSKQISGPGIPTATWTYAYSAAAGSWSVDCATPTSCVRTKTVTVTGPDDWQRHTFGTKLYEDEGKLLKVERGASATNILTVVDTTYQTSSVGQLYPEVFARSPNDRGDRTSERYMPERKRVTTQQGRTFTWEVPAACNSSGTTGTQLCFDTFGRPTQVVKTSAAAP